MSFKSQMQILIIITQLASLYNFQNALDVSCLGIFQFVDVKEIIWTLK